MDAAPAAYLGINNDSDTFGGMRGAINWARRITPESRARFLLADSQNMPQFPGDAYDLIHIDGQQDDMGWSGDLRKAIRQGRHILVDGYFWTYIG